MSSLARLLERSRFELLPTKGAGEAAVHLPAGTTVTVTASPRRGLDRTIAVAAELEDLGFHAVPHLSARLVRGPDDLSRILGRMRELGLTEAFVIGGDAPEPLGPYSSAIELLAAMAESGEGPARIGVGAYPEGHPLIDASALVRALLAKQAYASYMATQICFDPRQIGAWLADVRARGVTLPAYIGIPGAVERTKLFEISLRVGVGDSLRFLRKQGGVVTQLLRRRAYNPDLLAMAIAQLSADGADVGIAGFHVYTFNQVERTAAWRARLISSVGAPA